MAGNVTLKEQKSKEFDRLTESIRNVARDIWGVSEKASIYPKLVAEKARLQAEIDRVQEEMRQL